MEYREVSVPCLAGSDYFRDVLSQKQKGHYFILYLFAITSALTGIRRWNYFAVEQLLVYDIIKYRWCENVQRFHKSNNIMYVFVHILAVFFCLACFLKNLRFWSSFPIFCRIIVALKEEVWYQKCHDPECRNFRSSSKLWAAYDGVIKHFQIYALSSFLWKVTRYHRRSASATSWHGLVHFACVVISSSTQFFCISLTGRGRPALFNGWGWQHWTQSDSKLCTSGEGIWGHVGRQPRWPEICRVSGGLWTKERRNLGSASAYMYAGIGLVDGEMI